MRFVWLHWKKTHGSSCLVSSRLYSKHPFLFVHFAVYYFAIINHSYECDCTLVLSVFSELQNLRRDLGISRHLGEVFLRAPKKKKCSPVYTLHRGPSQVYGLHAYRHYDIITLFCIRPIRAWWFVLGAIENEKKMAMWMNCITFTEKVQIFQRFFKIFNSLSS